MKSPIMWTSVILFILLTAGVIWRFARIFRAISAGKKTSEPLFSTALLGTFLKKKSMRSCEAFFQKIIAGTLHTVLVLALLMMLIETAVFTAGFIFPITLSAFYTIIADITLYTSIAAVLAALGFMIRRASGMVKRFYTLNTRQRNDAYFILFLEMASAITYIIAYFSPSEWHLVHYCMMMIFAMYITFSKHLHIITALPFMVSNTRSEVFDIAPIKAVSQGLDLLEGKDVEMPATRMGALEPKDFSRRQILSAFACTQCGRCDDICPVATVNADFSPLQIMAQLRKSALNGTALYPENITQEQIYSCIGCGGCAVSCPIGINPMDIILQIRRYATLEDGNIPPEYTSAAQCTIRTGQPFLTKN
ncbi:MAG: (Fe-S)-binding protein [Flavobacteriales bacterium]|nr:(Fe-S)-binding protein [Flavobacteriales bacterium]